jgi:xanthosine phosphorylase
MSEDLFRAALAVRERAYAPYSKYRVGAALRGARGAVHVGANVENAAYPQGQCAETSAIGAMIAAGETRIVEVAVIGDGDILCTPCGGCRQRLREFAAPDTRIHLCDAGGVRRTTTLAELLPLSFGPDHLGHPTMPADAAEVLSRHAPGFAPRAVLVLGSGLGPIADAVADAIVVPYAELPGFPRPSVAGHPGRLVLGRLGGAPVAVLQGRVHLYEGGQADAMAAPLRLLKRFGADILVVTNAAGGVREDLGAGALMAITDHVNLTGRNPLTGPNDEAVGPRFPDMSGAYDPDLLGRLREAARRSGVDLTEGVYAAVPGPSYETPAEIRAFRALGADAVGMSTAMEVILARHAGYRVAGISMITNPAAGLATQPIDHADVLAAGHGAAERLARLLATFLARL